MSLRTRVVVSVVTLSSLALFVACGSGGPKVVPPPTGGFSNSNLNGLDGGLNPLASLAGFTLDASGNMSNGVQDINDLKTSLPDLSLSGTVLLGAAGAPGTAQFVTQTTLNTLTFDVFPIDSNHLK